MNLTLTTTMVVLLAFTGLIGIGLGYFLRWLLSLGKKNTLELQIKQKMLDVREEAKKILEAAHKKAEEKTAELLKDAKDKADSLKKLEDRLLDKDANIDKKQADIDRDVEALKQKAEEIRAIKAQIEEKRVGMDKQLEEVAKLSESEAKDLLLKDIEEKYQEDLMVRLQKLEIGGEERLDRKAKDILSAAIQRVANSNAAEVMTTNVQITSDEIKGKIIGKEGRNIRAFERATGVEVIIDETPGSIVLSSFDSVRRQVAKRALEALIKDGRIQPARIEEMVEKARGEIDKIMKAKAEEAIVETGVFNLDPRLVAILGRLYFRTSYGQNVMQHSIEMAHLAAILAEELGADVQIAKAGALLHDIGKAVDHEVSGTHVEIGRKILAKFGVDKGVIQAMQSHHEEYPYETLESVIIQTVDAISGGRPGARRDSVENYLKRLADLEEIATSFDGVEKAYAIAAGREIRIFVNPEKISDLTAKKTAQEIARRVERELKYPGEIKVNVIRENRVIEYAR